MPKVLKPNADSDEFYLIGKAIKKISDENLPTKSEVLSRFLHCRTRGQTSIFESLKECCIEVENVWALANILTRNHCHVLNKINDLYLQWTGLKKNKSRKSDKQRQLQENFSVSLEKLFDISYDNSLSKMEADDKERLAVNGLVIRVAEKPIERKQYYHRFVQMQHLEEQVSTAEEIQPDKTVNETAFSINEVNTSEGGNDDGDGNSSNELGSDYCCYVDDLKLAATNVHSEDIFEESDEEYLPPNKRIKQTRKTKKVILTPELAETLDRTKTSNREAVFILSFAAIGMGLNPQNMVINRESIRKNRIIHSQERAIQMQENFDPKTPLVLHWDGKTLPNSNMNQKVDRIAVVVTGHKISQTLGVPYLLHSATGKTQAALVVQTVKKWKHVPDKIEFLCFDTTNLNSGRFEGTCKWLQKLTGKRFLWLACRHHIMELIVGAAFQAAFNEKSKNKNITLFEEFRRIWPDIDKSTYESCCNDDEVFLHILPIKNELLSFIKDQLLNFPQTRDDYKELLILTLLVIGETAPTYKIGIIKTYVVHTCGALHRARWMAKLIYSLKIYLFRSQFVLNDDELSGLKRFIIFVLVVYIRNWYEAPCALKAAKNDLQLLKDTVKFKSIDPDISSEVTKTFSRHLWYLSEEIVGIAFFDNTVDEAEKRLMVNALKIQGTSQPAVKANLNIENVMQYRLSDFITCNSLAVFRALNISQEFLCSDPLTWSCREDYLTARNVIKHLKVVNDVAERAIAQATDFNGKLTTDEDQWQYLLQGVEHHRKMYPKSNKGILMQSIKQC